MLNFIRVEVSTKNRNKLENHIFSEDYSIFNNLREYAIIADGVTRDKYFKKGFSLAYESAKKSSIILSSFLFNKGFKSNKENIKKGFIEANNTVRKINEKEGLWENSDYLDRDLAGTCLASLIREKDYFYYGFVGDCRIFKISPNKKIFITKDVVEEAREDFPKLKDLKKRRFLTRKERRNNPKSSYKTYGVLTGEKEALNKKYFKVGRFRYKKGDIVGIFSDGVTPFFEKDKDFLDIMLTLNKNKINKYLGNQVTIDEKTLIFCRI